MIRSLFNSFTTTLLLASPAGAFTAQVYAPPTNVRAYPGGTVRCAITRPMTLYFSSYIGEWNYAQGACNGAGGYIHDSQIRRTDGQPLYERVSGYCILRGRTVPDSFCY